jgi:membrane protein implicated in regulation of membrane protease activity
MPVVYLAAWTMAYAGIFLSRGDGLDFRYYFAYLGSAWTFRGGELPTYIWYFSFILFLPLTVLSIFLLRQNGQRQQR